MTYPRDLLGRAPIMRERGDEEIDRSEDWKGESNIRSQSARTERAKKAFWVQHGEGSSGAGT